MFWLRGRTRLDRKVEHCFSLNKDTLNPYIYSVPGILETYHQVLPNIKPAGPTLFQFIIRTAISITQSASSGEIYHVLAIVTDGEIHDVSQTVSAIVESSYLPLSIVIVGVGLESFSTMQQLIAFPLRDENGRQSARENTQFVPFRNLGGNPNLLASLAMTKIPLQMVEYMNLIRYEPATTKDL